MAQSLETLRSKVQTSIHGRRLGIDNARMVGQALGRNPFAIIVPCHRVVAAGGKLGGFSANGGSMTKRRLLAIEGARRDESPTLFDLIS